MDDNFPAALAMVLRLEGGYVDDSADPGGATNLGVTRATLAAFRGRAVTREEVRALRPADVQPLYRQLYWTVIRGGDLPAGLDAAVFDIAVHSGPRRAVLLLQGTLGVTCDGILGPQTLAAAVAGHASSLLPALGAARLAFLRGLPGWGRFGRGWARRVASVEREALKLAAAPAGPSRDVLPPRPASRRPSSTPREIPMTDVKSIFASRTVWANIVGLASVALAFAGFDMKGFDSQAVVDAGLQVIAGGSFIASTAFRIMATRKLVP